MRLLKNTLAFVCSLLITSMAIAYPSSEGIHTYHSKQQLDQDLNRYKHADNIWDALRQDFSLPHYADTPEVQQQINWFMNHQDFLVRSATRASPYLYYIAQQVKVRHLPAELALLPMIESGYNPFAYSTAGASGIWQMMPATASGYGIKHSWWYDGRRDVLASTKAALNYLAYLGDFFNGNWLLASAAYDTGEGNVISAIRRNIRNGYSTDFWSLPVAQETREYVPRLLALAEIVAHPEKYPIKFPYIRNAPCLAQVDVGGQIDLSHASYLAGLSLKKLVSLNAGFNRSATDPNGPHKLVLPIENVQTFSENLARLPYLPPITNTTLRYKFRDPISEPQFVSQRADRPLIPQPTLPADDSLQNLQGPYALQPGDTLYMVREGDNLDRIADHYHMSKKTLQIANQFARSRKVRAGEQIIIPTHLASQEHSVGTRSIMPGDTVYVVRANDTIDLIAKKFHTIPSAIRISNFMDSNEIKEGDRLIIPTHIVA